MSDRLPGTSWSNPLKYRQYVIYVEPEEDTHVKVVHYCHEDWRGEGDARCGSANSLEAAKDEIDLLVIEGQ
jgi:hypothetical protein